MMVQYQWEKAVDMEPEKDLQQWNADFGPKKTGTKVRFDVLIDNPKTEIYLACEHNGWKKDADYRLEHDDKSIFATIETESIKHGDPYKFIVHQDGKELFMQDPAASYFDDRGNSVYWEFSHEFKYPMIDTVNRSTKILQTDLPGLIVHWAGKDGTCAKDIEQKGFYRFISESGIIEHVKSLGFNTVQFLPFAQSIDGDNWKYRYLVPFQYAIQKNWGNPDEFRMMIDEFHKHDIAVIGDFVLSHMPYKDYKVFAFDGKENGIQLWLNRHGTPLYMLEPTPWGTMRPDYDNPYVRKFFIQSCIHFLKNYRIDGFRIDNVDGIIRFGPHGQGEERPKGRTFLRELNKTIYSFNPKALIHFESHYFFQDNAKMLVVPFEEDDRALGATAYNSSRLTYYLHKEYMPKDAKKITPWKFRDINAEKEWGQSNSTVADFHNHDAAAGLMEMRCTGSYAYDAMTQKQPQNHFHAVGKIKVMESIISFCCEGRTLDLAQTFLLQAGTFEHDSSIQWYLTHNQVNRNCLEFKKAVNELLEDKAFWPFYAKNRKYLNVDDSNKILVMERKADSKYVIVINLSAWKHYNYKVGMTGKEDCKVVLNSDLFEFAGTGTISYPDVLKNRPSKNFEVLDREVELSMIPPYGVVVLKCID